MDSQGLRKHFMGNNCYWAIESEDKKRERTAKRLATLAEQKDLEERLKKLGQLSAQERIAYDRARLAYYQAMKKRVV